MLSIDWFFQISPFFLYFLLFLYSLGLPSRVQARALCFLLLFGVLGAWPTHSVRLQAYTATQAEQWRGQLFP